MAPPRRGQPGLDWKGRGPDTTLKSLAAKLATLGGELRTGCVAKSLRMEGGRCVGIDFDCGGKSESVSARAVVIADGGFQANKELVRRFVSPNPDGLMQRNAGSGRGDGLRMAEAVGAQLFGMESFYGHPLSRDAFHNDKLWPHPYLDAMVVSSIAVAADGSRFADEGMSAIYVANAIARRVDPLDTFVVFDDAVWRGPAADVAVPPAPNPTLKTGGATIHSAASLEELARIAKISSEGLAKTVTEYNAALATNTLEQLMPKRTLSRYKPMPVAKAPFYAIPMCTGITYTMGGPLIDGNARVLHEDGHPITGLYAVGSASGGLEGGTHVGYIGGLIKAFVTGIRAGEFIAASKPL
jgi:fumarate reductase flavoprotein subunit